MPHSRLMETSATTGALAIEPLHECVERRRLRQRHDRLEGKSEGEVTRRAKYVRPEFVEKVKQSTHWQHQPMVPNQLAEGADIWS